MNHLKNPFVIGGVIGFLTLAGLVWNYTEAVKAQNKIRQEQILSEERMKKAQLEQDQLELDTKIQAEKEAQQLKILAEQEAAEAKAEADKNAAEEKKTASAKAAYDAKVAMYREECKEVQDKNLVNFKNFMDACTVRNTLEYCAASEVGQLYADDFGPKAIQECIDSKLKTGW